jgi:hypothetical protein
MATNICKPHGRLGLMHFKLCAPDPQAVTQYLMLLNLLCLLLRIIAPLRHISIQGFPTISHNYFLNNL